MVGMTNTFQTPENCETKFTLSPNKEFLRAKVSHLSFKYNPQDKKILNNVSMPIFDKKITALIGPSGCGKTTMLRCFNRMHDLYNTTTYEGDILLYPEGKNILSSEIDPMEVRMRIGMVFQKPNPFPKSIFENVAYGLRVNGVNNKKFIEESVERSLKNAALWDEVKDDLKKSALSISGGQQQRLCIARALAVEPSVILMDEPSSALDPISNAKIEELIYELKKKYTIIIVTHNMQQAARVSDRTAFFYLGELIEYNDTKEIFTNPKNERTQNYITGRFG